LLLDNFDYAATARVHQHRSIVDDRIAILASSVFLGHVVVGHACFRKLGANSYVALITVRRAVLLNLTEINVTSPTGIRAISRLGGPDVAAKIWDAVEKKRVK
jgi:hypothetical protein